MLSPAASRRPMLADDRPALAAGTAPGVADPAQPVAAERRVRFPETNCTDDYVVEHRVIMRPPLAERQCLACGVVCECYPGLPCATCGASSFHLIPLRRRAA